MGAPPLRLDPLRYTPNKRTCTVGDAPPPPPPPLDATVLPRVLEVAQQVNGGGYVWGGGSTGSPFELRFKGPVDVFGKFKAKDGKWYPLFPKLWLYDSTTGEWVWPKQEKGTYCSGFTLGLAMKIAQERGLLDGKSVKELGDFALRWNGTAVKDSKDKDEAQTAPEKQLVYAMEKLGIGKQVTDWRDAKPGDFVEIWRTEKTLEYPPGSGTKVAPGHSVVFLNWVTNKDGERIGIHYRASNQSNGKGKESGVDETVEYFKGYGPRNKNGHLVYGNEVDPERTYIGRLNGSD